MEVEQPIIYNTELELMKMTHAMETCSLFKTMYLNMIEAMTMNKDLKMPSNVNYSSK